MAWLIQGDFNALISNFERSGCCDIDDNSKRDFLSCIHFCELVELEKMGLDFTWTNNQSGEQRIWRKLDRCLVNTRFLEVLDKSFYIALPQRISYHTPLLIDL